MAATFKTSVCSDSAGKESTCNVGHLALIPGLGRSHGEGERLLTPVFRPGESHGLYSPWGCKELGMTEVTFTHLPHTKHLLGIR